MTTTQLQPPTPDQAILAIERPNPVLLPYYMVSAFQWGPLFIVPMVINFLRYRTMRYRFDEDGVRMQWGGFVRKEVSLAYSRIQDIHITSGVIERWFGLARIEVQTASGGTSAEMTLEGLLEYQAVRDFLYVRSRTARGNRQAPNQIDAPALPTTPDAASTESLTLALHEVAAELHAIRTLLEAPNASAGEKVGSDKQ